ncbi:MAG: hypothetical protein ACRELY_04460 [Polyangiaceae bacterium]
MAFALLSLVSNYLFLEDDMTRAWWVAYATAATCVLMACGGTEDGRDYRVADAGVSMDDSGAIADAGVKTDASQAASGGSSGAGASGQSSGSGSGSGASGGGSATCEPNGSCGGLYYCNDDCYSDRCCSLVCSCSDPTGQTGTLECSLQDCTN